MINKNQSQLKIVGLILIIVTISINMSTSFAADNSNAKVSTDRGKTINQTIKSVVNGGQITIANGKYFESGIIIDKNISLIGQSSGKVIIDSSNSKNTEKTFYVSSGNTLNLINITLASSVFGGIYNNGGNLNIKNCSFFNNSQFAINSHNGNNIIESSSFKNNTDGAIIITGESGSSNINYNVIINNNVFDLFCRNANVNADNNYWGAYPSWLMELFLGIF